MAFIKPVTIYKGKGTTVKINQCHNPGRKTNLFAVRRDDKRGYGEFLGEIRFDGAWRQYVFIPDAGTKWSASCGRAIFDFCEEITKKWRKKWK